MKICVICEGCYPFVMGGVSSWLHALMQGMPQHQFVIWAIGAEEKKRGHYAYTLPDNVTELKDVYLDSVLHENMSRKRRKRHRLTENELHAMRELFRCGSPDWDVLFRCFSKERLGSVEFLLEKDFLSILEDICGADYPYIGFSDYFWTVRSMFLPLLFLMAETPPEADLYYAVSAGYAGVLGAMAAQLTGKPYMLTEHGIYTREREEEILRTDWVPNQFKDMWINMFYMFTRCAYHYASKVTALFYRASDIQKEIGCLPEKCEVVPNGVHYERFKDIPPKEPNGLIDIGAVLRIVPIKDVKTMLYAFALASAEDSRLRLHIMGTTDEDPEYFEECSHIMADLNLTAAEFTGRVNVVEAIRGMDFTLLTSLSEGQPLAVLESFAAGRPAITTNVGCCTELIYGVDDGFGTAGMCVPVMHQSALAIAMLNMAANPKQMLRMGENGRRRVEKLYQHPDMIAHYEQLFESLAAKGGQS